MPGIEIWGPYADRVNPTQIRAFNSKTRYQCFAGRVRAGKTIWMCAKMFFLNMAVPNNLTIMGRWVKKDLWNSTCQTWLELYPPEKCPYLTYPQNLAELEWVKFPNGSRMEFVPLADRDKWPGMPLGAFAIDQIEQCASRETFTDLMRRLCRPGVPEDMMYGLATANYEARWALFREFFKYKRGINRVMLGDGRSVADLFELFEPEQDENKKNIRADYFAEQIATLSPFERQRLIEGIDLENIGMVFPEWDDERMVREFTIEDIERQGPARYYIGYDYGMKRPSAFCLLAVGQNQRRYMVAESGGPMMRVAEHEALLVKTAEEVGFPLDRAGLYADRQIFETRTASIASEWSSRFPWGQANKGREYGRECVKRFMADMPDGQPGLWVHPRCENWRFEIPKIFFDEKKEGQEEFMPHTKDDYYDAGRYALVASFDPEPPRQKLNSHLTGSNWKKLLKMGLGYTALTPEERPQWLSGP